MRDPEQSSFRTEWRFFRNNKYHKQKMTTSTFSIAIHFLSRLFNSYLKVINKHLVKILHLIRWLNFVKIFPSIICLTEKAMAPHSSTLAWKIPWTEEPGRLQSMGSLRVGYDWATSLSLFTFIHWRRQWHLTPVFLPGESQGRGSLMGCSLLGRTESDTTKAT